MNESIEELKKAANTLRRLYRNANKDKINARKRAWNAKNKEKLHTYYLKSKKDDGEQA